MNTRPILQGVPFKFTGSMYYELVNLNNAPCILAKIESEIHEIVTEIIVLVSQDFLNGIFTSVLLHTTLILSILVIF